MSTERLLTFLSELHPISEPFRQAIVKAFTPLSLPRYYMLLEAPRVSEHAYFLDEGLAMSYTFVKGKKQVEWLWKPGQIMLSAKSFFEQVPATEFIQLRDHSELLCISYHNAMNLLNNFPEAQIMYRIVMNDYYQQSRQRTRDMQHLSAVERYQKLIVEVPGVEQHITQEDVASYLGITPQSLSRIKKRHR